MSVGTIVYRDYDNQEKQVSVEGGAVTDGATYTAESAEFVALVSAIDALTTGVIADRRLSDNGVQSAATPAVALAQTNIQFVVHYHAFTTPTIDRTYRIPTADLGTPAWFQGNTNRLDPAAAPVAALITAFEDFVRIDGDVVVVDFIEYEND